MGSDLSNTKPTNTGGRPSTIAPDDIVRAGREIGMRDLSLKAVAANLGVSATALYRHVDGRWGLERAVGESLLADLVLVDEPDDDLEQHLVRFAAQLRHHVLAHPGLGAYLQVLFPRGPGGTALIKRAQASLMERDYTPEAAIVLSSAVASTTINIAAGEERAAYATKETGYDRERDSTWSIVNDDLALGPSHAQLPGISPERYFTLLITAAIAGLIGVAPPKRPVADIVADLSRRSDVPPRKDM